MSECWEADQPHCPCLEVDPPSKSGGRYCQLRMTTICPDDSCPFAALLRALPSASEERLKAALAMLVVPWDYFEGANLHHVFEYPIEQLEMFLDDEAADREEVKSDE